MASVVEICNMALANLGQAPNIASIDPPEGSIQAELCKIYYPMARNNVLEMHNWSFSTKRVLLPSLETSIQQWRYAYAVPDDLLKAISLIANDAVSDTGYVGFDGKNVCYSPQDYIIEADSEERLVLYSNQEKALLIYQARIEDTTKFSALFTTTLVWHLASILAGPIIKGESGRAEAKRCEQMMLLYFLKAVGVDTTQRKVTLSQVPSSIAVR
ncbi:hypothetical protein [Bartonella sp. OT172YNZD]|uniref:hypothetical protein n=1 Tax=Bartonella sp. OT172YNZD TaxID=3243572 RepID=UPI0035CF1400